MKKGVLLFLVSLIFAFTALEIIFRVVLENNAWWAEVNLVPVYQYPINKYGLRDFEYEKEKSEDAVRIACVGDSFTWGDGIKFDDTYPKRLERNLNSFLSPDTGKKYEVLNISWCGYSTYQEIKKLEFIKEFHPDIIVWGYCLNDSEDWADPKGVMALRRRFQVRREPNRFLKFLYHNSYLISFVGNRLSNARIALGNKKFYKLIYDDSYMGWTRAKDCFQILRDQDVPIVVLIFPLLSYDLGKYPFLDVHKKIVKELEKDKLSYIDFYDLFKNEDYIRLQAVPYKNSHPSEIANRIIEEAVYNKLLTDYKEIFK